MRIPTADAGPTVAATAATRSAARHGRLARPRRTGCEVARSCARLGNQDPKVRRTTANPFPDHRKAALAEYLGFDFLTLSDRYHPWVSSDPLGVVLDTPRIGELVDDAETAATSVGRGARFGVPLVAVANL